MALLNNGMLGSMAFELAYCCLDQHQSFITSVKREEWLLVGQLVKILLTARNKLNSSSFNSKGMYYLA